MLTAGLALALAAIVAGAKWAVIGRFGSDMPYWDQWDAEGLQLLLPWFRGEGLPHLFAAHNEHRVVLTRLQSLALVLLSGQWDARLQCVVNAVLHAGIGAGCWLWARRVVDEGWHLPLFLLTTLLFGLPLAWESILSGFHSQQYWLIGLSFAAIVLLPFARPWTCRWWTGTAATVLALGTMASGLLAAAVVASVAGFRLLRRQSTWSGTLPTLLVCGGVIAVGTLTQVHVPGHDPLRAASLAEFTAYVLHSLQWPLRESGWAAGLLWLPWILVAAKLIRPPRAGASTLPREKDAQAIVALGGWVLLQVLASAYARGAGGGYPAARYLDTLALGIAVNGVALAWLLSPVVRPATRFDETLPSAAARSAGLLSSAGFAKPLPVLALAWTLALGSGLHRTVRDHLDHELPGRKAHYLQAEHHLRRHLTTNDVRDLPYSAIPYPDPAVLASRISDPALRAVLPVSVRPPLPLLAAPDAPPLFRLNPPPATGTDPQHAGVSPDTPPYPEHPTWGSFGTDDTGTQPWISTPLTAPLNGWLKFETAGAAGLPGVSLALHDATTGVKLADVAPSRTPGDSWRAAWVRAPSAPFVVVARDKDPAAWLAFSAPVEMSRGSWLAYQAARHGLWVSGFGAALAAALARQFRRRI